MTTETKLLTADELLRLPDDEKRHELVRGVLLTMAPAGGEHGYIAGRFFGAIRDYVERHRLGYVFAAETGFKLTQDPDTVRAPDVAYVAAGRFPEGRLPTGFPELVPDLVVQIVSPSDTAAQVQEKVHDWLQAGTRMVLVAYPSTRSITVYRSLEQVRVLTEDDQLDGADVLPGFTCPVRQLFGS